MGALQSAFWHAQVTASLKSPPNWIANWNCCGGTPAFVVTASIEFWSFWSPWSIHDIGLVGLHAAVKASGCPVYSPRESCIVGCTHV